MLEKCGDEKIRTLESHEKLPPLIEMAGSLGSRGGLGNKVLSSERNNSSKRCRDTFVFTTCINSQCQGVKETCWYVTKYETGCIH